jgi:uncharacterized RDD family membrane protein YckC
MSERHEAPVHPRVAEALQGRPAGLVSRAVAAAIDVLVVMAIIVVAYMAVSVAMFAVSPKTYAFPTPDRRFTLAAAAAGAITYFTIGWWVAGRSCGCAVMGLRVVETGRRNVRFVRALARALVCVLVPVGLALCVLTPDALALHDLLTRTRVVYDWRHQEP